MLQRETNTTIQRAGASIAGCQPADDDLPMVVWLRGDEDFYEDFSLSADDVMAALGIKRSRLTQISGRELRVGRIRIDRYTRPLYRLYDVQQYQERTRPPTTHQKAAQVVDEVIDKLYTQQQELIGFVKNCESRLQAAATGERRELFNTLARFHDERHILLMEALRYNSQQTAKANHQLSHLTEQHQTLQKKLQPLTELQQEQKLFRELIAGLHEQTLQLHRSLQQDNARQHKALEDLREMIQQLEKGQCHFAAALAGLEARATPQKPAPAKQPKIKRRPPRNTTF